MPSTYSTNLRLELMATGENSATWGTLTNVTWNLVEQAISGVANVTMIDADYTLTTTNAVADEARNAVVTMIGTIGQSRNVIVPSVDKKYTIKNSTTGGFDIVVKTAAGTGVTIPNGHTTVVYCDATNVLSEITYLPAITTPSLTLSSSLAVTSGGTGRATSTTAYALLAAGTTATGAHQTLAAGATTEILVGGGASALPVWTTANGTGAPVRTSDAILITPALGTPSALVGTNITGTASGLTAGNVTTNANLTGHVTSTGNAAVLGSFTLAQLNTAVNDDNVGGLGAANSWTAEQTFKEVKDTVHTISDGAAFEIDPANGSIQIVTLGANRTPAATNFAAGQIVLLGIDDGTAYTVTWSTVNPAWVKPGGTASAPTLATSGYTWVMLWMVGAVIYAAEAGKP